MKSDIIQKGLKWFLVKIQLFMKIILQVSWNVLSGEFFFNIFGRTPNGGALITLRAVFVSLILFLIYIGLKSRLEVGSSWDFDCEQLKKDAHDSINVLGAILAGVYAALYARFSDQWNYVAGLYNQIASCQLEYNKQFDSLRISDFKDGKPLAPEYKQLFSSLDSYKTLCAWKAGFIEDAEDLHLATKRMFKPAIKYYLTDDNIRKHFIEHTIDGKERLKRLEKNLS